jgi:hypothetical protein
MTRATKPEIISAYFMYAEADPEASYQDILTMTAWYCDVCISEVAEAIHRADLEALNRRGNPFQP